MYRYAMPSYERARDLDEGQPPSHGWLREVRLVAGLSQEELGRRTGRNVSSISRLEKSEVARTISLGKLQEIASALDCMLEIRLVPSKSFEAIADAGLVAVNRERKAHRKGPLRKPGPRDKTGIQAASEANWSRQTRFGSAS